MESIFQLDIVTEFDSKDGKTHISVSTSSFGKKKGETAGVVFKKWLSRDLVHDDESGVDMAILPEQSRLLFCDNDGNSSV